VDSKLEQNTGNSSAANLLVVESGDMYIWGSGSEGQLGMGIDIIRLNKPVMLQMDDRIFQVACGYYHTMLVTGLSSLVAVCAKRLVHIVLFVTNHW